MKHPLDTPLKDQRMLCHVCHGRHFIIVDGRQVPCPECEGFGELHCCDGLTEQPDPTDAAMSEPPRETSPPDETLPGEKPPDKSPPSASHPA